MKQTAMLMLLLAAMTQFPEREQIEVPDSFEACLEQRAKPLHTDAQIAQAVYSCAADTGYTGRLENFLP